VPEPKEKERHALIAGRFRPRIVDAWQAPVEMSLFVHAFNGGVRIREHGETGVPNLYACGEVAGGPHSADRLGGMAFAATQVFGARAGRAAAERAIAQPAPTPDRAQVETELSAIRQRLADKGGPSVQQVRRRIRDIMWWNAMICQDERGLSRCLEELQEIGDRDIPRVGLHSDSDLFRVLEVQNLWQTAQIVATLSRERKETRGPHYRTDYPETRAAFAGSFAVELAETPRPGERISYAVRLVDLTSE
jgi:succinate dehydrogenase/fumarate reductase flavoprotein subunit